MDVSQLEPADRDPRKLRNTALLLVAAMIVGAFSILWAYDAFGERTSKSDRPALEYKINDDCRLVTSDGEERDIQDLKGKVTLSLIATIEEGVASETTVEALRAAMAAIPEGAEKPHLLVFVLDGSEEAPEGMAEVLKEFDAETTVWRVAANEDGKVSVRAFLKNRMRFGTYPEKRDGEWVYDTKIVLLDHHLQIRGIPGSNEGWAFGLVAGMEEKFAAAKISDPDKELMPLPMTTERLTQFLINSITYLYENPEEKGQK